MDDRHRIGGATQIAAVVGWPIEHSLSPVIHNAAYEALGLDWAYVALPVAPGAVPAALAGIEALGFVGANVTMPHKETVASSLELISDDAALLLAVNTVTARLPGSSATTPTRRDSRDSSRAMPGSTRRVGPSCCSAPAVRPAPVGSRSRGRAPHGSWSRCGSPCAPKPSSAR